MKPLLETQLGYSVRLCVWPVRTPLCPEKGASSDYGDMLSPESKWGESRAVQSTKSEVGILQTSKRFMTLP